MVKWLHGMVLFTFILSGCSRSKETQQPLNTVVFSFPDRDQAFYQSLINDFYIQYPGIKVQLDPVESSKLSEQKGDVQVVSWDFASDEITWSVDSFINLQPLLAQDDTIDRKDFYPGVLLPFTNVKNLAAIPYGMDLEMLYYNKSIFNAQEIPVPDSTWNWDNFLNAAARLTDREHNIYGYSASAGYADSLFFLYQNGGSLTDEAAAPRLDSEANIEALSWYGRLFTTLNVAPTAEQAQRSFGFGKDVFALGITNGRIGMWTGAFSTRGFPPSSGAAPGFEFGIAPLPGGQNKATSGSFEAYAIADHAKNVEACWKLIKFLSLKPNPRLIPARTAVAGSQEYARLVGGEVLAAAKASAGQTIVVSNDQANGFIQAKKVFLEAVVRITRLQATPRQALEEAQKSIEK